ncbi:MAG: hypothetical protein OXB90_11600, partial [Acidimicrobiaceae bacterium]|nr:hypothetical protein [Acidimicrobiaceae bacterium]
VLTSRTAGGIEAPGNLGGRHRPSGKQEQPVIDFVLRHCSDMLAADLNPWLSVTVKTGRATRGHSTQYRITHVRSGFEVVHPLFVYYSTHVFARFA